jgi:phospholipid/cholesterol/gamma-HCH transport system substrate-binding protein
VEGLSNASEVRFSGLPVGQVVDVSLDPDGSGQIRVRFEVAAGTPVRTSSVATIESLGVTGVAYVGISSGDAADPLLAVASRTTRSPISRPAAPSSRRSARTHLRS